MINPVLVILQFIPPGPLSALLPLVCPGGWHVWTALMSFLALQLPFWSCQWELLVGDGKKEKSDIKLFISMDPSLFSCYGLTFPSKRPQLLLHSSPYTATFYASSCPFCSGEVMASSSSSPWILPYLSLVFPHLSHIFMNNIVNLPQVFNLSLSSVSCENSE